MIRICVLFLSLLLPSVGLAVSEDCHRCNTCSADKTTVTQGWCFRACLRCGEEKKPDPLPPYQDCPGGGHKLPSGDCPPLDPSPASVDERKCAAESKACLECALACSARKGCKPSECVAVCQKIDECLARSRR